MKRRLSLFALLIAFALCFAPGIALADNPPELWVASTQVTSANASNVKGAGISGKVSYDAASNTLTLNGATINCSTIDTTHGEDWYYYRSGDSIPFLATTYYGIYQSGKNALTVKLVGTNKLNFTITGKSDSQGFAFGKPDGAVKFTGSGSLAITNKFNDYNKGVVCTGLTVASGSTLKVTTHSTDDDCYAVDSNGSVTVKGTLSVKAYSDQYAVGVDAEKTISVPSGGKLAAKAWDGNTMHSSSIAVEADGLITVGGTLKAETEDVDMAYGVKARGGLTVKKGGVVTAKVEETFLGKYAYAVYAPGSVLTVNGKLTATSNAYGIDGGSDTAATLKIGTTGELTATGNNGKPALENVKVTLNSSKLQVLAGDGSYNAKEVSASGIGTAGYVHIVIVKKANPMTVKANPLTFKASNLKKKAQSAKAAKAFTVKKAKGAVTYKVTKYLTKAAKGKVKVSKKGQVTVAKGTKKGTYKLKVKVTAAGNTSFKAKSKTVTMTITVK